MPQASMAFIRQDISVYPKGRQGTSLGQPHNWTLVGPPQASPLGASLHQNGCLLHFCTKKSEVFTAETNPSGFLVFQRATALKSSSEPNHFFI
jgi:hypothetical protein